MHEPSTTPSRPADGHRSAEARSLAMHRLIGERLDDEGLERARARVAGWQADGSVDPHWADAWARLLTGSVREVAQAITDDEPAMRQLRQTTPFAGALSNRDRWRILREVG
jgi:hypothetical protein